MFIVFAVKPLLVIYMMSWAVTDSVNSQLWLYKTCKVNFNYSGWFQKIVYKILVTFFFIKSPFARIWQLQKMRISTAKYKSKLTITNCILDIWRYHSQLFLFSWDLYQVLKHIIILHLWKLTDSKLDKGRKPLMVFPFFGHILSGTLMLLNVYYEDWDARLLWLSNMYIFFGGYTLLSIAM